MQERITTEATSSTTVIPPKAPSTVPTMGRIVLFTKEGAVECPAIVTGWQSDNTHRDGTIGLTAFTSGGPVVEFAPGKEGAEDAGGRRWRWPPRV